MADGRMAEILLVEDNEGDIELTKEAFERAPFTHHLHVAEDGDIALDFVFKRNGFESMKTPDIILLDLNLPGTDGREVLGAVKEDPGLKRIPVLVLTSSSAERDLRESYQLGANCYMVKPVEASRFMELIHRVESFWFEIACLPPAPGGTGPLKDSQPY